MDVIVLTKVGGILGPFALIFGLIMNAIYEVLDLVGIPNVALTIILFTLIANILMLPLTIKQQRYSRVSALVTPEIQKINKKYKRIGLIHANSTLLMIHLSSLNGCSCLDFPS